MHFAKIFDDLKADNVTNRMSREAGTGQLFMHAFRVILQISITSLAEAPGDTIHPHHVLDRLPREDPWADANMMEVLTYLQTSERLRLPPEWSFDLQRLPQQG